MSIILILFISQTVSAYAYSEPSRFTIRVKYITSRLEKTLYLFTYNNGTERYGSTAKMYAATPGTDSLYTFEIPNVTRFGRFQLFREKIDSAAMEVSSSDKYIPISSTLMWETDDDVVISLIKQTPPEFTGDQTVDYKIHFTGKRGVEKYLVRQSVDSAFARGGTIWVSNLFETTYHYKGIYRPNLFFALSTLKERQKLISTDAYNQIKIYLLFQRRYEDDFVFYKEYFENHISKLGVDTLYKFLTNSISSIRSMLQTDIPPKVLEESTDYIDAVFRTINLEAELHHPDSGKLQCMFEQIGRTVSSVVRDRLYVLLFARTTPDNQSYGFYTQAIEVVKDRSSRETLLRMNRAFPGLKAYDFELTNEAGEKIKLSQFSGKKVVIDIWATACGACAILYKEVVKKLKTAHKDTVIFLSISLDRSEVAWKKNISSGIYTSHGPNNLYTNGQGWDHPIIEAYQVYGIPVLVIVDRDGTIQQKYNGLPSSMDFEKMYLEIQDSLNN